MKAMKTLGSIFLLIMIPFASFAYDGVIAVQSDKNVSMQVFVNGKLHNKQEAKMVRVLGTTGYYHLEVRVLNPWNKKWYTAKRTVNVERGIETHYKVVFINKTKPELVPVNKYPAYSKYYLNPSLYSKSPVS
jgi:hypothetical protein